MEPGDERDLDDRRDVEAAEPSLDAGEVALVPSNKFSPNFRPPEDHERCTHTSSTTGERCKNWRRYPSTICAFHAALTLRGAASPTHKHGRYSKYVPRKLRKHFLAALRDQTLDELRRQMALLEAREIELMERIDAGNGESDSAWLQLRGSFEELRDANRTSNAVLMRKALDRLEKIIYRGSDEAVQWMEIRENMEMRRRLVETDRKREEYLRGNVPAVQMGAFAGRIIEILKNEVHDNRTLSRIADAIRATVFGEEFLDAELIEEAVDAEDAREAAAQEG